MLLNDRLSQVCLHTAMVLRHRITPLMRRKDERNSDAAAEPHVDKGACALSQAWLDHSQMPAAARGRMAGDGRLCPIRIGRSRP